MTAGTKHTERVAFVQPFGLAEFGGGPKVLKTLLKNAPLDAISINTTLNSPVATNIIREFHLPRRPTLGRLEKTRFYSFFHSSNRFFSRSFQRKFADLVRREEVSCIHAIAHTWDCLDAFEVAQDLGLPFALTVHDDLLYAMKGQLGLGKAEELLARMWEGSDVRFVISEEIGEEYGRRYGKRAYIPVTDGLEKVADLPRARVEGKVRIYFMGLFHQSYTANFHQLLSALEQLGSEHPELKVELITRCGSVGMFASSKNVTVSELPFAAADPTAEDMRNADIAYLPLPFGQEQEAFTRYSLSTKMIGYLGSGLPILYHGPSYAAACKFLERHDAAQIVSTMETQAIVDGIVLLLKNYTSLATAGLQVARSEFLLEDTRTRFWNGIKGCLENRPVSA